MKLIVFVRRTDRLAFLFGDIGKAFRDFANEHEIEGHFVSATSQVGHHPLRRRMGYAIRQR